MFFCRRRIKNCNIATPIPVRDFNQNAFTTSTIEIFQTEPQLIDTNQFVFFNNKSLNTGISFSCSLPGTDCVITTPGVYYIAFTSNVFSPSNTNLSLSIAINGTNYSASTVLQTITANSTNNIKTHLCFRAISTPTHISIINNSEMTITFSNSNLVITKTGNY